MGYDAEAAIRIGDQHFKGKVVLETSELIIRGPSRVVLPLADVRNAEAADGWLRLTTDDRLVELELGEAAAKWARRISSPPSRLDKLGVKSGMTVVLLGDPGDGLAAQLTERGARVTRRAPATPTAQIVFLLVRTPAALHQLAALRAAIVPDGAIWVLRPKGQKGAKGPLPVTEAESMAAGKQAGLVDVKVVAFSPELTAEKYVIPVAQRPRASRG